MERKPNIFGKYRIIKNLVVMSLSSMLVFTAYDGQAMLQSTMNKQMGTVSLAVLNAAFCLSSLILPKYSIKKLGSKVIYLIAATLFVPYVAANFYPNWMTLITAALLMGVGSSLIWAALTSYFNESVVLYCFSDKLAPENKCNLHPTASFDKSRDEKSLNSNFYRGSVVSGNKSIFTSVEVLSSCEALSKSNSPCIKVLAGINPNCESENDFPEVTPGTDSFEEYSRKTTVLLTDEEFASTEDLVINDTDNSFLVINSKLKNEQLLSLANLCFSEDVLKQFDCKIRADSSSCDKFYCNHFSEIVNHKSKDILYSTRMKFKGETASDVKDVRSRYLNKNTINVSVISNVHETCGKSSVFEGHDDTSDITNTLQTCEIKAIPKVSNVDNHKRETIDIHDKIDVQYEYLNPKKIKNVSHKSANIESVTARFFGSNGLAYHSAHIWGNLISYCVLQSADSIDKLPCLCGASLCSITPECLAESSEKTGDNERYLLTGISVVLAVLAILLVYFFLDPLGKEKEPVKFSLSNLMATLQHSKKMIQLCLAPISLYVGMIQGFYTADFTRSYLACALGESKVGLITIFYGLSCALSSTLFGYLVKYTGRIPIFLFVQLINISAMVFLLVWSPDPDRQSMFYVPAVMLGMVNGILWSQVPAFHGILFKKDEQAAFASYYLFNSLGTTLSLVYSEYLCTSVKIYILLSVSSLGTVGYLLTERIYRTQKN